MAQGEALRVMGLAYKETNDTKYLHTGKQLLHSFYVLEDDVGIAVKTKDNGWWYEEYADDGGKKPCVLNGMMYAILGVYDYYEVTQDPEAKFIF